MIIVLYNNNNSSTMSVLAVDNLLTSHTNIKVKDSIKKNTLLRKKRGKKCLKQCCEKDIKVSNK